MLERTTSKAGKKATGMVRSKVRRGIIQGVKKVVMWPLNAIAKLFKNFFSGRLSTRAHWTAELLLVFLVCSLFAWINWHYRVDRFLSGPNVLRKFWLGWILFFIYLTGRLGHLVYRFRPRAIGTFKDVKLAMLAGYDAAAEQRIDIQDSPLFLVVGADAEIEKAMMTSSFVGDRVVANDSSMPVHWYGDADALWVTLPGVSGISAQCEHLDRYRELANKPGAKPQTMRIDAAVREQVFQRMQYAVSLLQKLRAPVVPVNGIVVLVPYSWMTQEELSSLVDTIKLDMAAIQDSIGVKCMSVVLFHGIERNREFVGYLRRIPEAALQRRCGCTLPAFTESNEQDHQVLHDWLARFFRQQVYGMYRAARTSEHNANLFRFLESFELHRKRFCHALDNAFPKELADHVYLSGVYFVHLSRNDRTFFDGVAAKLVGDHDEVIGWTDERKRSARRLGTLSSFAAAGTIALVIFNAVLVTRFFFSW